jgi:hypothetical protein
MPIAHQAERESSSLCRFLGDHLPELGEIEQAWAQQLKSAQGLRSGLVEGWDVVGGALEVRIGLDLAQYPEPRRLLTYLPQDRCSELLEATGFERWSSTAGPDSGTRDPMLWSWRRTDHGRTVDVSAEELALATCLDLMEIDVLAHKYENWSVDHRRSCFLSLTDPHSFGRDRALIDALGMVWKAYVDRGREQFRDLGGHVMIAPELVGGFGIADLVVGRTLVEVKLSGAARPPVDQWLRQLLGYLLLDWDDMLRVESVAVYAAWQGLMLTCSVDQLLEAATKGSGRSLVDLRDSFRLAMRRDVDSFLSRNAKG